MGEKKQRPNYFVVPNVTVEVVAYVDVSKPDAVRVLSETEEKKLPTKDDVKDGVIDHTKLPETTLVEWSKWVKPSWGIHAWIEEQSWSRKSADPRLGKEFDLVRYTRARVRALMVDWSLSTDDKSKALVRVPEHASDGTPVQILSTPSMTLLSDCMPALMNVFYNKAMDVLYPTEEEVKN